MATACSVHPSPDIEPDSTRNTLIRKKETKLFDLIATDTSSSPGHQFIRQKKNRSRVPKPIMAPGKYPIFKFLSGAFLTCSRTCEVLLDSAHSSTLFINVFGPVDMLSIWYGSFRVETTKLGEFSDAPALRLEIAGKSFKCQLPWLDSDWTTPSAKWATNFYLLASISGVPLRLPVCPFKRWQS